MSDVASNSSATTMSDTAVASSASSHLTDEERQIYDRQLRVWGVEAQKRMRESSVLLIGVHGLSCEIAKNLVLAGVGSLTLLDDALVRIEDLGANFLITQEDVGKNRAEACVPQLRLLNPNVVLSANTASLSSLLSSNPAYFTQFRAVCMIGESMQNQIRVNQLLRTYATTAIVSTASSASSSTSSAAPISSFPTMPAFFTGEVFGLYAWFFEDLYRHTYSHTKKELNQQTGVTEEQLVIATKVYQHDLASLHQLSYERLKKIFGRRKHEHSALDHYLTMRSVMEWRQAADDSTRYPSVTSNDSAVGALYLQRELLAKQIDLPLELVSQPSLLKMARMAGMQLPSVCAVVGGILGQEILKVLSGKDEPLANTFVYAAEEGIGMMKDLEKEIPKASANVETVVEDLE